MIFSSLPRRSLILRNINESRSAGLRLQCRPQTENVVFDGQPLVSPKRPNMAGHEVSLAFLFVLHHLGSVSRVHVFGTNWNASVNDKARFVHPFVLEKRMVLNLPNIGFFISTRSAPWLRSCKKTNTPGFVEYSNAAVSNAATLAEALQLMQVNAFLLGCCKVRGKS